MRALLFAMLLFATPAGASSGAPTSGKLIDRVVAVISTGDGRGQRTLITLSDLEAEARITLISRGASRAAAGELPQDTLAATLDWLISEHLLMAEAEQLAIAQVEPAELAKAVSEFESKLGSDEYRRFLERLELSEADLGVALRRRIVVERYLVTRLRLGATVSDAEVHAAFDSQKDELGLDDFAAARDSLRAQLERKRRQEVVETLVAALRSRAQVRVLHSFGKRPSRLSGEVGDVAEPSDEAEAPR